MEIFKTLLNLSLQNSDILWITIDLKLLFANGEGESH